MKKLIKADIKGLTALQACMASILCQVNGVDSAREFTVNVKKKKVDNVIFLGGVK